MSGKYSSSSDPSLVVPPPESKSAVGDSTAARGSEAEESGARRISREVAMSTARNSSLRAARSARSARLDNQLEHTIGDWIGGARGLGRSAGAAPDQDRPEIAAARPERERKQQRTEAGQFQNQSQARSETRARTRSQSRSGARAGAEPEPEPEPEPEQGARNQEHGARPQRDCPRAVGQGPEEMVLADLHSCPQLEASS